MRSALLLLPWLLAGAACAAWAWQSDRLGVTHGLGLLLWLMGAGLVLWELRQAAAGVLRWDGQAWNWAQAGYSATGIVTPRLDWQHGLLLEFRSLDGRVCWLWSERQAAPIYWEALRRALYAPTAAAPDPRRTAGAGP
jgi:hypothetical protein